MDHDPSAINLDAALVCGQREKADQTPTGGLAPGYRASQRRRFPGDHRRLRVSHVLAVGIHYPGHYLLIGPHVGSRDVLVGTDEVDDLGRIATGHPLLFSARQFQRIDSYPTLGAAKRQTYDGALPGHEHGQRRNLTQIDVGGEPDATLGRAHGEHVLNPVAEEAVYFRVVVVTIREGDDHGPLRDPESFGNVFVQPHSLGDTIEPGNLLGIER